MHANFAIQHETVINTYRQLPEKVKQRITLRQTSYILTQKVNLYAALPYAKKCSLNTTDLAQILYKKFKKAGIRATPAVILHILKAEEAYYNAEMEQY